MNLRVFYLTRRGISDGYERNHTEQKKSATLFAADFLLRVYVKIFLAVFRTCSAYRQSWSC